MKYETLLELCDNRTSHKSFANDAIPQSDIDKILYTANGNTPAQCNEFNYHVDIVPDKYKQLFTERLGNVNQNALSQGIDNCVYEVPTQYNAPLLLLWTMPDDDINHKHKLIGNITGLYPSLIALGMSVWNAMLAVEALGYDCLCTQMTGNCNYGQREDVVKDILQLPGTHMPIVTLSIGKGIEPAGLSRKVKQEDLVGKLVNA
jgi:hypothetical protein